MLYKLYNTRLFSIYLPLGGVIYYTSLLFYMAGKEESRNEYKKQNIEELEKSHKLHKPQQLS
jgi:hypothetical protein